MSLSIILDKSAFQMLNNDEAILLHNYYRPNVTPILVMEVLGDLKKEFKDGKLSSGKVIEYANKIVPFFSVKNAHYKKLMISNLIGNRIALDFRPALGGGEVVETEAGARGIFVSESPEEKALNRWREGNFMESEKLLAEI